MELQFETVFNLINFTTAKKMPINVSKVDSQTFDKLYQNQLKKENQNEMRLSESDDDISD